ncbi:hypothetical protein WN55_11181 [Dufourea novaeangliae]|uniref:Uncharacterized protein n=1 Tax=Dufourea novaeangliae TaxID=178035 RepID=A0A154PDT9_DUFNO|nr:hypothetical protein WN55_11181 [Dufourea novaeangliae]
MESFKANKPKDNSIFYTQKKPRIHFLAIPSHSNSSEESLAGFLKRSAIQWRTEFVDPLENIPPLKRIDPHPLR